VVLRPAAADGYRFVGWTGVCSPALEACRIEWLEGPLALAAHFEELPPPSMRVVLEGTLPPWSLVVDDSQPRRIVCPSVCDAVYERGARVRLTWVAPYRAVAEEGCVGQPLRANAGYCDIVMEGDRTVRLRFMRGNAD
jgi:hypothetical protein